MTGPKKPKPAYGGHLKQVWANCAACAVTADVLDHPAVRGRWRFYSRVLTSRLRPHVGGGDPGAHEPRRPDGGVRRETTVGGGLQ